MKRQLIAMQFTATVMAACLASYVSADEFGYACEDCPTQWGNLEGAPTCGAGLAQSPIAVSTKSTVVRRLRPVRPFFGPTGFVPVRKGTNVEAEADSGGFYIGHREYEFVQFHFHSISEHMIDGEHSALELHMVHRRVDDGALAVLSVLVDEGRKLRGFDEVMKAWRETADLSAEAEGEDFHFDVSRLMPTSLKSFRYRGSTTTPPCVEQVRWIILTRPIQMSANQIATVRSALFAINEGFGHQFDNNRPVQPRNNRHVFTDDRSTHVYVTPRH